MAKKNSITSAHIKSLMEDQQRLSEEVEKNTKESINAMVDEHLSSAIQSMLESTDEDDDVKDVEINDEESQYETEEEPATDENADNQEEDGEDAGKEDSEKSDDIWADLEGFKNEEDGSYDLRGATAEQVMAAIEAMGDDDSIDVITVTAEGDGKFSTETADTEDQGDDEEELDIVDDDDDQLFTLTDEGDEEDEEDDNLPTDDVEEEEDDEIEALTEACLRMVKQRLQEDDEYVDIDDEELIDEEDNMEENTGLGATSSIARRSPNASTQIRMRQPNAHYEENDGIPVNESKEMRGIRQKVNNIIKENKELRQCTKQLAEFVNKTVVINESMAKIIRLVTENATTAEEKKDMVERFNKVKTRQEAQALYESISTELSKAHSNSNAPVKKEAIKEAVTKNEEQGKQRLVETSLYKSSGMEDVRGMMQRLDKIR